ncbi:MAG: radical SAM/SPASM domain-containing protein [Candidatus Bathyarchaeia archaeon]|jgi:MoaA/NifB/PqqE/SkfB family radical SAM enzyme
MVITPKILAFFVTNRCNARCSHCFNWKTQPTGELSLEEIKKIDFSIFDSVSITGGEPTLRTDLAEVCSHVAKNKIYLNTNGLKPERIQEVIERVGAGMVNVTVSIDGTRDVHDQIRGVDCFDLAVETIKLCRKAGVEVTILSTISRYNIGNIPALMDYLKNEGLFYKKGDIVFNIARGLEHAFNVDETVGFYHNPRDDKTVLTLEELKKVYATVKPYMANQNSVVWDYSIKMLSQHKKLVACYAGNMEMVLHANGDVAACEYTKPFANVRDYDFDILKLWNSQTAEAIRSKLCKCYCIHPCNLNTAIPRTLTGIVKLAPDILKNKTKLLKRT